MSEVWSQVRKHWRHWYVYSTCTFFSVWVLVEFALANVLFTVFTPSTLMFYFTPAVYVFGESIGTIFFTAVLFLSFLIILRTKVYVFEEGTLKFNQEKSFLLLPFYFITLSSLAVYIVLIPLELTNLLTYISLLILAESFVEHYNVSGYTAKIKRLLSKTPTEKEQILEEEEVVDFVVCPLCSTQMEKGANKCSECNFSFEKERQKCDNCSAEIPVDADVCPVCDEPLEEKEEEMEEELEKVEEKEEELEKVEEKEEELEEDLEKDVEKQQKIDELTKIEGVDEKIADALYEEGVESRDDLKQMGVDDLIEATDIDFNQAVEIIKEIGGLEEIEECPLCLADIPEGAKECPECGEPLYRNNRV